MKKRTTTIVGIFDDHKSAVDAINDLRQNGISDDQIGFVVRHDTNMAPGEANTTNISARGIIGGLLGAADLFLLPVTGPTDASTMLQAVLPATEEAIEHLPHRDPQKQPETIPTNDEAKQITQTRRNNSIITGGVVGGTLGAVAAMLIPGIGPIIAGGMLTATFGAAAIGSIASGFLNIGIPEQSATYYEEQFHAGHIILTVKAHKQQKQVMEILRHNGAHEVAAH